ncbi:MAG: histidinol-phosphate transaminase [Solobacterium sp.]|nr:histidinol-phosphate transaminase [Solobacterium sp.]
MSRFMNRYYSDLEPYVPGEQPRDRKFIKLNTNESPYPPSPAVLDCFNRGLAEELRLYEDPTNRDLNAAIAGYYNLSPDMVLATGGSDEALELAFMAYCEDGVAYADVTYGFYPVFSKLHHIDTKIIPLKEDFTIDPKDYEHLGRAIVIANPNAPTGTYLSRAEIEQILKTNPDHVVIVDEAYVDFGNESMIPLTREYDNLVVTQTFSKSRNLAGARIAFAAGNSELIRDMETLRNSRNPYNVTRISQRLGIAAINDVEYFRKCCDVIVSTRGWTKNELEQLGFSGPESHTNFLFVKHETLSGEEVYQKLREKGILVRHFTSQRIKDYNRITIGSMAEMIALCDALKEIVHETENR